MNSRDKIQFRLFLRNLSDKQVLGVFEKEAKAGRDDYAELAADEAYHRQLDLSHIIIGRNGEDD